MGWNRVQWDKMSNTGVITQVSLLCTKRYNDQGERMEHVKPNVPLSVEMQLELIKTTISLHIYSIKQAMEL